MFALLTLLSYTSFRPDPPVVLVQPGSIKIEPGNTTLADVANKLTKDTKILILKTDFPLRRNTTLEGAALDKAYVFLNSSVILEKVNSTYTDCKSISDPTKVTADVTCGIVANVSTEDFKGFWNETDYVIVASEIEPVLKYGLANPFTPNVWNCFFYFLLMIVLVCWAMSHYATIDVQTRFAKKNN